MLVRLSPRLSRAGRALLGWRLQDLADASGVSPHTLRAFERKDESGRLQAINNRTVIATFEAYGLTFIPENGGGAGVRLSNRAK